MNLSFDNYINSSRAAALHTSSYCTCFSLSCSRSYLWEGCPHIYLCVSSAGFLVLKWCLFCFRVTRVDLPLVCGTVKNQNINHIQIIKCNIQDLLWKGKTRLVMIIFIIVQSDFSVSFYFKNTCNCNLKTIVSY